MDDAASRNPDDYVVATGEAHSVREFLDLAAAHCGLDWTRHVETDPRYFRPTEVDYLMGDASKVRRLLGWKPRVSFEELVRLMVDHDLELASQEQTLATAGHPWSFAGLRMDKGSRIFVAGHKGLAGSAICRRLCAGGYTNLLLRTRAELDLRDRPRVEEFFRSERPEYVFLAAAKVGGILANSTYPADFLFDNLSIQNNVIDAAARYGVTKLAFLARPASTPSSPRSPCAKNISSPASSNPPMNGTPWPKSPASKWPRPTASNMG